MVLLYNILFKFSYFFKYDACWETYCREIDHSNTEPILGFYKEGNKQQIIIRCINKMLCIMKVNFFVSVMESSNHNGGLESSVYMRIVQYFPL